LIEQEAWGKSRKHYYQKDEYAGADMSSEEGEQDMLEEARRLQ
jgi:hypothetical protein